VASAATPNPCSAGFLSQVFSGNAIVCSDTFKNYEAESEKSQIQSVADNAAAAYGQDSLAANVAQTAADQQEQQATDDVNNVTDAVASSTAGQIFTTCSDGSGGLAIPGLPCIDYNYIIYGVIGLVLLYVFATVASFIPKPR